MFEIICFKDFKSADVDRAAPLNWYPLITGIVSNFMGQVVALKTPIQSEMARRKGAHIQSSRVSFVYGIVYPEWVVKASSSHISLLRKT